MMSNVLSALFSMRVDQGGREIAAHFAALRRLLDMLDGDLRSKRHKILGRQQQLLANAAFWVQAVEDGEIADPRRDLAFSDSIGHASNELGVTEHQLAFVEEARRMLALLLERTEPRRPDRCQCPLAPGEDLARTKP